MPTIEVDHALEQLSAHSQVETTILPRGMLPNQLPNHGWTLGKRSYGFTNDDVWVRFKLKNTSDLPLEVVVQFTQTGMRYIKEYRKIDGIWQQISIQGLLYPFSKKPLQTKDSAIGVSLGAGESQAFYP